MQTKENLINGLYTLYTFDNCNAFDINEALMTAYMTKHSLHFREKDEIADSEYWNEDRTTDSKFFDELCPGNVMELPEFTALCEQYIDFEMYAQVRKAEQYLLTSLSTKQAA